MIFLMDTFFFFGCCALAAGFLYLAFSVKGEKVTPMAKTMYQGKL